MSTLAPITCGQGIVTGWRCGDVDEFGHLCLCDRCADQDADWQSKVESIEDEMEAA